MANELGVLENNVSRARGKYAPETIRSRRSPTASSFNWYKTAKKYDEYTEWFQSSIKRMRDEGIDPFSILHKYDLMADDIYKWYVKNEMFDPLLLHDLKFETAVVMAKKYFNDQAKAKSDKKQQNSIERDNNKNKLRDKYVGQECYLNGYPAKIEEDRRGRPVVKNNKGHESSEHPLGGMSWNSVDSYFPYFMGGGIYRVTDTAKDIRNKIKEEEIRPPHPVQSKILLELRKRLHQLVSLEGQFVGQGQYFEKRRYHPFIEPEGDPQTMPSNQIKEVASSSNWYKRSQPSL